MANVKRASDTTNLLLSGSVAGMTAYGLIAGLRELQRKARMRQNLAKLEEITQRELAKDDISISGNLFKDKYKDPVVKSAEATPSGSSSGSGLAFTDLPAIATLGAGAGLGWVGSEILHELLKKKNSPKTPQFAVDYKNKRQKEFERAVRLLRAVTDAPTWRDMATAEKTASLKKEAWIGPLLRFVLGASLLGGGVYLTKKTVDKGLNTLQNTATGIGEAAGQAIGDVNEKTNKLLSGFENDYNNYVRPAIAGGAITLGGYVAYKSLKKLLYNMRNSNKKDATEDAAVNAWLAQRQELGEAGKSLNTYIENNDAAERKELNNILKAYEARYKK